MVPPNDKEQFVLESLRKTENYQQLIKFLKHGETPPSLRGLRNTSTSYFLASLIEDIPNTSFLVVFPSHREAEQAMEEVRSFRNHSIEQNTDKQDDLLLFPAWQNTLFEGISPTKNISVERMRCLNSLIAT